VGRGRTTRNTRRRLKKSSQEGGENEKMPEDMTNNISEQQILTGRVVQTKRQTIDGQCE
jgi:hypothetical protein